MKDPSFKVLYQHIVRCRHCPRLVDWREQMAEEKRSAFRTESYWGRPVPGFGDAAARLLIVGLAPAAHGANRTGRMFTGDRSGEWLYRALARSGFANTRYSGHKKDGLELKNAYVTAIVRCAPPQNKPQPRERDNCLPFLDQEMKLLTQVSVIVALGAYAWDGCLRLLSKYLNVPRPKPTFRHGGEAEMGRYRMIGSYHPSQQNTFTGKLTEPMLDAVFSQAQAYVSSP